MDRLVFAYFVLVLLFGLALLAFGPLGWGIAYAVLSIVGLLTVP